MLELHLCFQVAGLSSLKLLSSDLEQLAIVVSNKKLLFAGIKFKLCAGQSLQGLLKFLRTQLKLLCQVVHLLNCDDCLWSLCKSLINFVVLRKFCLSLGCHQLVLGLLEFRLEVNNLSQFFLKRQFEACLGKFQVDV